MGGRRAKNLLISVEASERADRYAELHGTTVSRLVEDFLSLLPEPITTADQIKSPLVLELLGVARPRGWVGVQDDPHPAPDPGDMDFMELLGDYLSEMEAEEADRDYRKA
jgi:hypothetical protein